MLSRLENYHQYMSSTLALAILAIGITFQSVNALPQTKDLHKEALEALSKGNLSLAEQLENELIKDNPKNANAYEVLAVIYSQQGKASQSEQYARLALKLNPNFSSNFNLAEILIANDKPDEALVFYSKALQIKPNSIASIIGKSNALIKLGSPIEALDFLQKSNLKNNAELQMQLARTYFVLGDMDKAESTIQKAISQTNHYEAKLLLAEINFQRRNLPAAVIAADALIKSNPSESGAYILLAECFVKTHSGLFNAIELVKSAKSAKNKAYVFAHLAQAFDRLAAIITRAEPDFQEKKYAWHTLAQECWHQAVSASPNDAQLRYRYAQNLRKNRNFVEAYYQVSKSLELDPNNEKARLLQNKLKQAKYDLFGWLKFYLEGKDSTFK